MRVAVVGAGGAGGYFGARLALAGVEVIFIARGAHLAALQSDGLYLESIQGSERIHPVQATADPGRVGTVDVVLLGVKTWQLADVIPSLPPLIGPDTLVVPLQNGVEAADQLIAALGPAAVVGGLCRVLSFIAAPGHIRHLGGASSITLGELDNRPSARTTRVQALLTHAGVKAEIPADIHAALWEKFLFVTPFGGVGAVTRAPIGVLRALPETRQLLWRGMEEIAQVAQARGVKLDEEVVSRNMGFLDRLTPDGVASLQRDILAGRPSELEAWNGAVVRLGEAAGVATPVHRFIYQALLPQERQARGEWAFPA